MPNYNNKELFFDQLYYSKIKTSRKYENLIIVEDLNTDSFDKL